MAADGAGFGAGDAVDRLAARPGRRWGTRAWHIARANQGLMDASVSSMLDSCKVFYEALRFSCQAAYSGACRDSADAQSRAPLVWVIGG